MPGTSFKEIDTFTNNMAKRYKMNKIVFITGIISLLFSSVATTAQQVEEKNGIYYQNGEPFTGTYETFFENGQLKREMELKNGKKDGKVKIYLENGQISEIHAYKNNKMHGKWVVYNKINQITSVARYKNGKKHGKWKIWNDEGNLLYELQYKNGKKSGTWKNYNEKGEVIQVRKY